MAQSKDKTGAESDAPAAQTNNKSEVRVEALVDNLGPKLLRKGDVTSDEEYVALLKTDRGRTLVREAQ